jgi:ABC-type dipeptide/oligopeptide/nickel transport system permease component
VTAPASIKLDVEVRAAVRFARARRHPDITARVLLGFERRVHAFWIGLMVMFVFALKLRLLRATGMHDTTSDQELTDPLRHLVLPASVTALVPPATIARIALSLDGAG